MDFINKIYNKHNLKTRKIIESKLIILLLKLRLAAIILDPVRHCTILNQTYLIRIFNNV